MHGRRWRARSLVPDLAPRLWGMWTTRLRCPSELTNWVDPRIAIWCKRKDACANHSKPLAPVRRPLVLGLRQDPVLGRSVSEMVSNLLQGRQSRPCSIWVSTPLTKIVQPTPARRTHSEQKLLRDRPRLRRPCRNLADAIVSSLKPMSTWPRDVVDLWIALAS